MNPRSLFGLALACAALPAPAADAQPDLPSPLISTSPVPHDGTYMAGDHVSFVLDHLGDQIRLRFSRSDEVFYLTSEAAPLGARVLKYDTGTAALRVTGWGGVTLYTPDDPAGIPAEYTDVVRNVDPPPIPAKDVKLFAAGMARDIAAHTDFSVGFAADWDELAQSDTVRELVCDALRNASYALEQAATGPKRNAISDTLHVVQVIEGNKVNATIHRGVLTITIDPKLGPSARPSSLAIAHTLGSVF
jgi:hypothetical protein